jgi:putative transposase
MLCAKVGLGYTKKEFTKAWLACGGLEQCVSASRRRHRRRSVLQRKYWEHAIRDRDDFGRHLDYIHYNPVKHGLATCPHAWPYSTFADWVRRGVYAANWQGVCDGQRPQPPCFDDLDETTME